MLDLGTSFTAVVERDPEAIAVVDEGLRWSFAQWHARILAVAKGLSELGLGAGDHLVSVLQNRWEAATLHWACQYAGVVITPLNWRAKADELDYVLADAEARGLVYQDVSAEPVSGAPRAADIPLVAVGDCAHVSSGAIAFTELLSTPVAAAHSLGRWDSVSLMLYTSGTTGRGKGVPRRHCAERSAAVAHVAQNQYGYGERTLGVMPLYHTMGVRSLLSMALVSGTFVCLPRFDAAAALELIERERITNLYLVPTLYHDLLSAPEFASTDLTSVAKLGFAGAPMTDGLLSRLSDAFRPELFVNHYGSSEIYTFTICPDAPSKPGSAGKAGINQRIRVVPFEATGPHQVCSPGQEGQIIASLESDEAFDGYWKRPDADERALREGWYFTGDTGYQDEAGDLFVTGRVDDMIISGGENISPVEIESVLSLHPAVVEIAVVGLPDERLGQRVAAFIKRSGPVHPDELDTHCRESALAEFKRPRDYVFVTEIPKSPVGKILRRLLLAGEYQPEA